VVRRELDFFAHGERITGVLNLPGQHNGPVPIVVISPGWDVGEDWVVPTFAGAGLATFVYSPIRPSPPNLLLRRLRAAIARIRGEDDVDGDRIGVLGIGPMAGAVALLVAADDPWIGAVSVRDAVLEGSAWLRQCSGLGERDWEKLLVDVQTRLRARTLDNIGGTVVIASGTGPLMLGAPIEIDLATFDHVLRLRTGAHLARIRADALYMTTSSTNAGSEEEFTRATCTWFLQSLRLVNFDVMSESL
jgi:hypothetical protein